LTLAKEWFEKLKPWISQGIVCNKILIVLFFAAATSLNIGDSRKFPFGTEHGYKGINLAISRPTFSICPKKKKEQRSPAL
jgi:hypothetical protein